MRAPEDLRYFDNLVHGLESNMENLRIMRKTPGFLPEHGWVLEKTIEAQTKLLEEYKQYKLAKEDLRLK